MSLPTLIKKIKIMLPSPLKARFKKIWHRIRPPRIRVTRFIESGCVFEVTTKLEKHRVTRFGDEEEAIEKMLSEVKPGEIFYDIGSCVGLYAIHAARLGCKVVAFEPDPNFRKRLKRNIKINKLNNKIQIIDWAVSDDKRTETLYSDGVKGNSPSLRQVGDRGKISIRTDTIDNAIFRKEIPSPDILKMDIEGAEILALKGMHQLMLSSNSPRLMFIEFHPNFLKNFDSSFSECRDLVKSFGYKEIFSERRSNEYQIFYMKVDNYV